MVIAAPLFTCVCSNKSWLKEFLNIWGTKYICSCFYFLLLLCSVTVFYAFVFLTIDSSLFIILFTQIVHFVCATFFLCFLKIYRITFNYLCDAFVNIFVIQTFIEIVACMNPSTVGAFVRVFNRFDPEKVTGIGSSVRGYALSAATTYHLSLVYGVAFIIYIKRLIEKDRITFSKLVQGCLVVIGIFFAGRTGFVGVGIACLYFMLSFRVSAKQKISAIIKFSVLLAFVISCFFAIAPKGLKTMVIDNLIPYAFEFVYQKLDSGKAQTASTNQLKNMWATDFDTKELVIGSGKYTDTDGKYYMHVDPGVLRHLLYGGIIFYILLLLYQVKLTFPLRKFKKRNDYFIFVLIFIYFVIMDFKGVTIAANKFAFVSTLLFSYAYLYLEYGEHESISCYSATTPQYRNV